jgi:hypothetical protein
MIWKRNKLTSGHHIQCILQVENWFKLNVSVLFVLFFGYFSLENFQNSTSVPLLSGRRKPVELLLRLLSPAFRTYPWSNSRTIRWIFMKLDIGKFYENLSFTINFYLDQTCFKMTLHQGVHFLAYLAIYLSKRKIFRKAVEKNKTHFISNAFSPK